MVNRWNKAIAVGLRHNHDISFIATQCKTMAIVFYVTNYATKVEDPVWKRVVAAAEIFDDFNEKIAEEQADAAHGVSDDDGSRNNKTRQFLMKVPKKRSRTAPHGSPQPKRSREPRHEVQNPSPWQIPICVLEPEPGTSPPQKSLASGKRSSPYDDARPLGDTPKRPRRKITTTRKAREADGMTAEPDDRNVPGHAILVNL